MKIIDKLSTYAALIGVISAIGGGFYAWGEFNTRLSAIEKKPPVNLQPLKQKDKELEKQFDEVLLYANEYKVDLIDRIKKVDDKIQTTDLTDVYARISEVETTIKPTDLTNVYAEIAKVREELAALDIPEEVDLSPVINALQTLEKAVAIVQKENQVQDAMIEEIKLKANNPLAN
jgi:hypothetical protein